MRPARGIINRLTSPVISNYFEGQGGFVSRLIMGIIRTTILWVAGVTNLLTNSP